MSWLGLDPAALARRQRLAPTHGTAPSLSTSLRRGMAGFTVASIAGFAPWALAGGWLQRTYGELGLYAACAMTFITVSTPLLHRLIVGPGSWWRFQVLFAIAFGAHAVAWSIGWMRVGGHAGSVCGLLAGTALMGAILVWAFAARGVLLRVVVALSILDLAGYFAGGWVEGWMSGLQPFALPGIGITSPMLRLAGKLLWGVCYGLGAGAGIGLAFHACQAEHRAVHASPVAELESKRLLTKDM
jgi:hypothetical protein